MMLKKTLAILFGFAFLSFVAVQYNDPDPLLWMLVYGFAAVISFLAAFDKMPHRLLWLVLIGFVAGGVYMWPVEYEGVSIGAGDIKNIEEARESLGLFLGAVVFASFILLDRLSQRAKTAAALRKARWA